MSAFQREISLISKTQQSLLSIQYIFVYIIIVCVILCGIGYALYKKSFKIMKDYDEDKLKKVNELINIHLNKMERNYQKHIQRLENQIKSLEFIVDGNVQNINKMEMNYQEHIQHLENQIKSLEFIVDINVRKIKSISIHLGFAGIYESRLLDGGFFKT